MSGSRGRTIPPAKPTLRRLDKAFQRFFGRIKRHEKPGHPRFKGRAHFDSVEFPAYGDGVKLLGSKLRIQHVGTIKVKMRRPVEGKIKTVMLVREADLWYVVFSVSVTGDYSTPCEAVGDEFTLRSTA